MVVSIQTLKFYWETHIAWQWVQFFERIPVRMSRLSTKTFPFAFGQQKSVTVDLEVINEQQKKTENLLMQQMKNSTS